jgi:hypothetical protein
MYKTCSQEIHAHQYCQQELAGHVDDLVEEVECERKAHKQKALRVKPQGSQGRSQSRTTSWRWALEVNELTLERVSNHHRLQNYPCQRTRLWQVPCHLPAPCTLCAPAWSCPSWRPSWRPGCYLDRYMCMSRVFQTVSACWSRGACMRMHKNVVMGVAAIWRRS